MAITEGVIIVTTTDGMVGLGIIIMARIIDIMVADGSLATGYMDIGTQHIKFVGN